MSLLKDPHFLQNLDLVLEDPIDTKHLLLDLIDDGWRIDRGALNLPHKDQVEFIRQLLEQIDTVELEH